MPTRDRPRPAPFITGLAGGVIVALIGVWLAVAPFASGYQPDGADWVDPTAVGVATGVVLAVLGLATAAVIGLALRDELCHRGLAPQPRATAGRDAHESDDVAREDTTALEAVLAPLATALLNDLRNGDGDHRPGPEAPDPRTAPRSGDDQPA